MHFAIGVGIAVALAWVIYGVLSVLGIENAGDIAAYTALGIVMAAGLVIWFKQEEAKANVKICPDCRFSIPRDASVCGHCRHRFD